MQSVQHRTDSGAQVHGCSTLLPVQKAVSKADCQLRLQLAVRAIGDRDVVLVGGPATLATPAFGDVGQLLLDGTTRSRRGGASRLPTVAP